MKPDGLTQKAIRHADGVACISSFCTSLPEIRSIKGLFNVGGEPFGPPGSSGPKEDYATVLDTVRWQESQ